MQVPVWQRSAEHSERGRKSRVLVVDDEPLVSQVVALALAQDTVETFESPYDALARARETSFDFVLSDFKMPHMNGVEFYEALMEVRPALTSRFALMTASVIDGELAAFLHTRRIALLRKPFDLGQLGALVHPS
jgi:CheY-like chemotaxis protein